MLKSKEKVLFARVALKRKMVSAAEDFCEATRVARRKLLKFARNQPGVNTYQVRYKNLITNKKQYIYDSINQGVKEVEALRTAKATGQQHKACFAVQIWYPAVKLFCEIGGDRISKQEPLNTSFLLTNIRSIINKCPLIDSVIDLCEPDIIALTETWLQPAIGDHELFANSRDFSIYRCDRNNRSGGGVLLAINKRLPSDRIQTASNLEIVWAVATLAHQKIILGVCYRPQVSLQHLCVIYMMQLIVFFPITPHGQFSCLVISICLISYGKMNPSQCTQTHLWRKTS